MSANSKVILAGYEAWHRDDLDVTGRPYVVRIEALATEDSRRPAGLVI